MISAAFSYSGIVLLATVEPTPLRGLTVWVLLAVGYAFDSADGQVARLEGSGSPRGEWLDHVVDAAKMTALHLAVLIAWYRWFDLGHPALLLIPIVFGLSATVWFFALVLTEKLRPAAPIGAARPSTIRALLVLPTDYGIFCLVFSLLGFHRLFLAVYAVLCAANLVLTLASLVKWYGDVPGPAAVSATETALR